MIVDERYPGHAMVLPKVESDKKIRTMDFWGELDYSDKKKGEM